MSRIAGVIAVIACVVVVGCGGGVAVQPVKGTVTIGGTPAPENTRINFAPIGDGMEATGIVDAQGNYELFSGPEGLPGALVGEYMVYLTPDASDTSYMDGGSTSGPPKPGASSFPKDYTNPTTTPLKVAVESGDNSIPIEIP